jgi:hypothetical protein
VRIRDTGSTSSCIFRSIRFQQQEINARILFLEQSPGARTWLLRSLKIPSQDSSGSSGRRSEATTAMALGSFVRRSTTIAVEKWVVQASWIRILKSTSAGVLRFNRQETRGYSTRIIKAQAIGDQRIQQQQSVRYHDRKDRSTNN